MGEGGRWGGWCLYNLGVTTRPLTRPPASFVSSPLVPICATTLTRLVQVSEVKLIGQLDNSDLGVICYHTLLLGDTIYR